MELEEVDRKINIYILSTLGVILAIVGVVFLNIYFKRNKSEYLTYREDGKIKYDVSLFENEYFSNNTLEENNQYIASLIDKVNANFKYNMKLDEECLYNYKYKITADVSVVDQDTKRHLYNSTETILEEVSGEDTSSLWIDENVSIDYKKYNDLITKFINVYNLKEINSNLNLHLYLGISGENWEMKNFESPVTSLNIPLAVNTIAINPEYNLKDNLESKILLGAKYENAELWLKIALGIFGADACVFIGLAIYMFATATEKDKYKHKLKSILNNYGSYISAVEDEIDMEGFKVLKVATFVDLLEIRDTVHMPIIMVENKEQFSTYFAIPSNDILYFFNLGIEQPVLASGQILETEENNDSFGENIESLDVMNEEAGKQGESKEAFKFEEENVEDLSDKDETKL